MAKGSSKAGGGAGGIVKQATENVKGINGYEVTTANGNKLEFFMRKVDGETFYSNQLGAIPESTPNGMSEQQMLDAITRNGGTVRKYSKQELVNMESQRLKDRQETNEFLNQQYARNKGGDQVNKAYRNTKKANRMAKRR
ncbi:MAG: hypothetical protein IKX20_02975 [Paludibacteraceae bacterium]|nr:hypothetical protein [Paludibacteraceae bacterium]